MIDYKLCLIIVTVYITSTDSLVEGLLECHDDISLKPPDGLLKYHTFTWLGVVRYLHVITGEIYWSKSPRVVLIHKQYVLGTASDIARVPLNYKLGNVIFGDYEQDEKDCNLTKNQIRTGVQCQRAYLEIPTSKVVTHPEFSRFRVRNSLSVIRLIRPLTSLYMVPVCLPSRDEREVLRKRRSVFMVDYKDSFPMNFESENLMAKKTYHLYTPRECERHLEEKGNQNNFMSNMLCTTGCGVRNGAPIITQSDGGVFELVGLSSEQTICKRRSMRQKLNNDPAIYIDVFPYKGWIINVITAQILPDSYSMSLRRTDIGSMYTLKENYLRLRKKQKFAWHGKTYIKGNLCFSPNFKKKLKFFYSERFEARADPDATFHINLKISSGIDTTILCARLMLPSRMVQPEIQGIGGYNITVLFDADWFPYLFYFTLTLAGKNSTAYKLEQGEI